MTIFKVSLWLKKKHTLNMRSTLNENLDTQDSTINYRHNVA